MLYDAIPKYLKLGTWGNTNESTDMTGQDDPNQSKKSILWNAGMSARNIQENVNVMSKSSELTNDFQIEIQEIIEIMKGIQFNTTDIRNRHTQSHANANTLLSHMFQLSTTQVQQLKVDINTLFNHVCDKEMNFHIKTVYYEALEKEKIFHPDGST